MELRLSNVIMVKLKDVKIILRNIHPQKAIHNAVKYKSITLHNTIIL